MSAAATPFPRLRPDIRMVEQVMGGERSVVVKDPTTGKYFRMHGPETQVLRAFDGTRSFADVARVMAEQGMRMSEGAVEAFARSCSRLGLLERTLGESSTLELERLRAERSRRRSLFRGELMRMRFAFPNSDRIVAASYPWFRWCFSRGFIAASIASFVLYVLVIAVAWPEFSRALLDVADLSRLSAGRVATYVIVTLVVTIIHEFGHAFTCKHYGGDVSEMGFMIIYLQPAFYCNVNDAWSFPDLRARLWVTAAGMWIQLVVAGIAAAVWWLAVPGTWTAEIALAAMIAGGLTSVLTNMNPLLPLDGYFALTDWLAIPNLRQRGMAWVSWWVRHRLLGVELPEPAASPREARVLRWYGALAGIYITTMLTLFSLIVVGAAGRTMGGTGVVLALAALWLLLGRHVRTWSRAVVEGVRQRAGRTPWRRRAMVAASVLLVVGLLPWRARVRGDARAAGAADATISAPVGGVVTAVLVREGERTAAGAPLLQLTEPSRAVDVERLTRVVDSLQAGARRARVAGDAGAASLLEASMRAALVERAAVAALASYLLRAPLAGELVTMHPERLLGRRVAAGAPLLRIVDADSVEVRVALAGTGAARVRAGQEVRLAPLADPSAHATAPVTTIAASDAADGGRVEVRVRLPRSAAWRPGARAEAQVMLERTIVAVAVWRTIVEKVRPEVFL